MYVDYLLEIPEGAEGYGYGPAILLARRGAPTVPAGQTVPVDIFTGTVSFLHFIPSAN